MEASKFEVASCDLLKVPRRWPACKKFGPGQPMFDAMLCSSMLLHESSPLH